MIIVYQIKKEIYTLMRRGIHEPAVNDTVHEALIKKILFTKYAYELSDEEFNAIGDELADSGDFHWDDNGKLALSAGGMAHLSRW